MSREDANRHQARERALCLLYEARLKAIAPQDLIATLVMAPPSFVAALLRGVEETSARAEKLIGDAAIGWPLNRMATVDLLIMRMAVSELSDQNGAPVPVILDEAVELANAYSTERSGRFINGILARIASSLRDTWDGGESTIQELFAPGGEVFPITTAEEEPFDGDAEAVPDFVEELFERADEGISTEPS
jgi:N utilization substance protein B